MELGEHYIAAVKDGKLRIYAETRVPGELAARLVEVPAETRAIANEAGSPRRSFRAPPRAVQIRPRGGRVAVRGHNDAPRDEAQSGFHRLAQELDTFLTRRPSASWDFAGSPSLYASLVEELAPSNLRRLKRVLAKIPQSEYRIAPSAELAPVEGA
jgi:hypothetical protein